MRNYYCVTTRTIVSRTQVCEHQEDHTALQSFLGVTVLVTGQGLRFSSSQPRATNILSLVVLIYSGWESLSLNPFPVGTLRVS